MIPPIGARGKPLAGGGSRVAYKAAAATCGWIDRTQTTTVNSIEAWGWTKPKPNLSVWKPAS
jgi:hypothetical protein